VVAVLQLHLIDADAEHVAFGQFLHPRQGRDLNVLPAGEWRLLHSLPNQIRATVKDRRYSFK
jgi:hypothetical protein